LKKGGNGPRVDARAEEGKKKRVGEGNEGENWRASGKPRGRYKKRGVEKEKGRGNSKEWRSPKDKFCYKNARNCRGTGPQEGRRSPETARTPAEGKIFGRDLWKKTGAREIKN